MYNLYQLNDVKYIDTFYVFVLERQHGPNDFECYSADDILNLIKAVEKHIQNSTRSEAVVMLHESAQGNSDKIQLIDEFASKEEFVEKIKELHPEFFI